MNEIGAITAIPLMRSGFLKCLALRFKAAADTGAIAYESIKATEHTLTSASQDGKGSVQKTESANDSHKEGRGMPVGLFTFVNA